MKRTEYKLFRQKIGKEVYKTEPYYKGEVALTMSGGIDSCILCAVFSKQYPKLRTYSIGFIDSNEFKLAEEVAKIFKTNHKSIVVTRKEYVKFAKELIKKKKLPVQVPNEVLLYMTAHRFSFDIKGKKGTLLMGEGGDEFYGGYTNIMNSVPIMKGDLLTNYLDRIVYDIELWFRLSEKERRKYKAIFKKHDIKGSNYDRVQNWIKCLHYPALMQRARSINLVKGITVDLPYKNPMLAAFAEALPRTMRVNKTFLRVCYGELFPREVLEQEKIGFGLPINLMKWQEWCWEVHKNGDSKINFWK